MKHILITVVGLIFLIPQIISAEELRITVLQKGTGDPVEGATVVLKKNGYTTTNEQGVAYFEFVSPESATHFDDIKILNQGYDTLEQVLDGNPPALQFYLRPNLAEIEGLEVVEERVKEKTSKIVLSAKELRAAAGSQGDPLKVLQSLPGVVAANGSGSGQVYMRGSALEDNQYWVDGLPLGYIYHWGGVQSVINPALVSDFNVFLGGFPVEYGDTLGGVIDVKLRAPKTDRIHTNLHLGTYESSLLVEGPIGDSGKDSFYLAGRRSYIDLLFSPAALNKLSAGNSKDTVVQVPKFYDMQGLYRHETTDGYLDFQYFKARDQLALILEDTKIKDPQLAGDLNFDTQLETFGLNWKKQWGEHITQHVSAGVEKTSARIQFGTDPYGDPFYTNYKAITNFLFPSVTWEEKNTSVKLGFDYRHFNAPLSFYVAPPPSDQAPTPGGFSSETKYKVDTNFKGALYTPYIKHTQQWNDKWKTSLGIRYTYSKFDHGVNKAQTSLNAISPRFSAEYQQNDNRTWLLSWGNYFQSPGGLEFLDGFGNPQLNYTWSEHRILGVEQKLNDTWSVKAEVYHKPMRDLVVETSNPNPPNNYINKGEGVAYGFDLFIKRKAEGRRLGWLSYSWSKSKRKNLQTGETTSFAGDQPHTLTAIWGQPFTGSWSKWDWGMKFQAHSGLPYTKVIGRVQEPDTGRWLPVYGEYNADRLPVYAKLDIRIAKEVLYDTWKLKYVFDIQNVTFRQNVSDYEYEDDFSNYNNPKKVSDDLFLPFFGIEAEF